MDTVITKLSNRSTRPESVFWLEDSFNRLSKNGFSIGTRFSVTERQGRGLVIRKSSEDARNRISSRRDTAILSLDSAWIARRFAGNDFLRVRISYLSMIVVPRVLTASIIREGFAASITGNLLEVDGRRVTIDTARPASLPVRIASITAHITPLNLVYAIEAIMTATPAQVTLGGPEAALAGAFLLDAGFTCTGLNHYAL